MDYATNEALYGIQQHHNKIPHYIGGGNIKNYGLTRNAGYWGVDEEESKTYEPALTTINTRIQYYEKEIVHLKTECITVQKKLGQAERELTYWHKILKSLD